MEWEIKCTFHLQTSPCAPRRSERPHTQPQKRTSEIEITLGHTLRNCFTKKGRTFFHRGVTKTFGARRGDCKQNTTRALPFGSKNACQLSHSFARNGARSRLITITGRVHSRPTSHHIHPHVHQISHNTTKKSCLPSRNDSVQQEMLSIHAGVTEASRND